MILSFLLFLLLKPGLTYAEHKYLPQERIYTIQDVGYLQYNSPDLLGQYKYVLTYDDGPHEIYTPQILDLLKKFNVKATFYIVGSRINNKTLPILKRMIDEGHILANHTWDHAKLTTVSAENFKADLRKTFKALNDVYQMNGQSLEQYYFRFPFAAYGTQQNYHHMNALKELSQQMFGKNCIHFTFWDIDSGDWIPEMTPSEVFNNIKAHHEGGNYISYKVVNGKILKKPAKIEQALQGGIILFHDIQERTIQATYQTLNYFAQNKIEVIPLSETQNNNSADFQGCQLAF
jgi:peptidoglycan/xylan/chitin deacetylase (PgdA/CDA1 family)